jgi:hypothetical protein
MGPGVLLLLWFVFGRGGKTRGQGGISKNLTLKGRDGRTFRVTFYGDGTRFVDTDRASFWVEKNAAGAFQPTEVVKGDQAAVQDALANLPE